MLTTEQIAERRKGIGGSDAGKIVAGDWYDLWLEKTGRKETEDLSRVFAVQLGIATEELNLRFGEYATGAKIERRGEVVVSALYPFMRCTLDGYDAVNRTVWQAKHCNGFSKIAEVRARYVPQVTHEMIVCGCERAILSVIIGCNEPVLEEVVLDDFFATEYIEQCRQFWHHVETDTPPAGAPAIDAPPVPVSDMREEDMTGSNAWASAAADWINHGAAAKLFDAAQKDIKSMVAPDVRLAYGHGIRAERSKRGLSIKRG